jgi:hypothetical protein
MGRVRKGKATVTLNTNDLRQLMRIRDELGLASTADTVRVLIRLYSELRSLGIKPTSAPDMLKTYKSMTKKIDELTKLIKLMIPKETQGNV